MRHFSRHTQRTMSGGSHLPRAPCSHRDRRRSAPVPDRAARERRGVPTLNSIVAAPRFLFNHTIDLPDLSPGRWCGSTRYASPPGRSAPRRLSPCRVHWVSGDRADRVPRQSAALCFAVPHGDHAVPKIADDAKHLSAPTRITAVLHSRGSALTHPSRAHMIGAGRGHRERRQPVDISTSVPPALCVWEHLSPSGISPAVKLQLFDQKRRSSI